MLNRTCLRKSYFDSGLHEPEVAFLDEVEDGDFRGEVVLGDADDQPQVRLDQAACVPPRPRLDPAGELQLLLEGQELRLLDLVEVGLEVIVDGSRYLPLPAHLSAPTII